MPFLDTRRQRAALLVILLGVGIAIAVSPYASGLIGAAVLYVLFAPLSRAIGGHIAPAVAAGLVTAIAVILVIFPGLSIVTLLVNQAQDIAGTVLRSPLLQRLGELEIAGYEVGPRVAGLGEQLISWLGSSAFGLIGTATRLMLNLTIAFFGLYFLLLNPDRNWDTFRPFIPFSAENTNKLRQRFRDVTNSTLIGLFLVSLVQGVMIGLAFWALGLSDALFWGIVTGILAILPVVGSGLIWGPAAITLALNQQWGTAIALALWGAVIVGSADNVIRPLVYRKWARIHPMVTLVGAFAGIRYFGLLGILIGPLMLNYFFELMRMYRDEFITPSEVARLHVTGQHPVVQRS